MSETVERPPPEDEPNAKKKRGAERGLTQADIDGEERPSEESESQDSQKSFAKADEATLKSRRIIKVRRKGSSALEPENANALENEKPKENAAPFSLNAPAKTEEKKAEDGKVAEEKKGESSSEVKPTEEKKGETSEARPTTEEKKEETSDARPSEEKKENNEEKKEATEEKKEKGPFGFFSVDSPFSFGTTSTASPFSAFTASSGSTFNFATTSTFGSAYSAGSSQSEEGSENPSDFVPTTSYTPVVNLPVSSEPQSTGEEDEVNVYTFKLAKLYGLEEGNWKERGEGTLKINEAKDGSYSRILLRTIGILALKLNSRIFPTLSIEKVGAKQVRFMGSSLEKPSDMVPYLMRFREASEADSFVSIVEGQKKKLK